MRIKRPEKYYKVKYVTDISQSVYSVYLIAECLTLESASTAYTEAVRIHGWDSGAIFVDLVETGTNTLIERTEISVDDVIKSKLEGEEDLDDLRPNNDDRSINARNAIAMRGGRNHEY